MSRACVPDSLLTPLLDTAADVLRGLSPAEIPSGLRALAGFDRRGLANATARHQLRRAFDVDEAFRAQVVEAFTRRPEVQAVLRDWAPQTAVDRAAEAADRDDLDLWTSVLYAADPQGAEFGLGVACSEDRHRRTARTLHEEARASAVRLASAEEAQRRAEAGLAAVRAELARVETELRDERRSRRDREAAAERRSEEAARALREAEAALDRARRESELAEARARREAERARDAERRLRERARPPASPTLPATHEGGPDTAALADAARRARELAAALDRLAGMPSRAPRPAGGPAPEPTGTAASPEPQGESRKRRAPLACPAGLRAEQPDAIEAMLRTPGMVLMVDGYNVSMAGWSDAPVDQQRDQLISALMRLHLRLRCHAIVVFDGADVEGVPHRRTPGVRVVFSPAGQPADPVIIRELRALPRRVPVLVASSDGWVRDEAGRDGATVVPSDALLAVLRR